MPVQTKHVVVLLACLGVGVSDLAVINGVLAPRLAGDTRVEPEAVAVVTAAAPGEKLPAAAQVETSTPRAAEVPALAEGSAAAEARNPEAAASDTPPAVASAGPESVAPSRPEVVASSEASTRASPEQPVVPPSATAGSAPTFEDIQFGTRSAELSEAAETRLHQVAQAMRRDKSLRLVVRGHTDERGDDTANEKLAAARADHTARFISRLGVSRSRISVESAGSREPLDQSGTREAWAKNRRVQFVWK